jgi:outer membrane lipopolysaccharide assembly protein LptE/RlpB|tara:strand:- start:1939 stop:2469 length:531 start_codon:yes stop_codon:yes gene_type:complete
MKKLISIAVLSTLICSFLVGCGWHLRNAGTAQVLGNIGQVFISGDESSLLYRTVIKSLKFSNVGIADTSEKAGIVITLINQRSKSRTATVSSSARVSELQITELVDIIISTGNGEVLLPKTTLRREKFFTYNEDNVSTNNEENKMLQREMTRKLARNIILRLNATIKTMNRNEPES